MIMRQMPTKASGYNKIQRSMNHFENSWTKKVLGSRSQHQYITTSNDEDANNYDNNNNNNNRQQLKHYENYQIQRKHIFCEILAAAISFNIFNVAFQHKSLDNNKMKLEENSAQMMSQYKKSMAAVEAASLRFLPFLCACEQLKVLCNSLLFTPLAFEILPIFCCSGNKQQSRRAVKLSF